MSNRSNVAEARFRSICTAVVFDRYQRLDDRPVVQCGRGPKLNISVVSLPTGWPFLRAGSNRQSIAACTALGLSNFRPALDASTGVALMTLPSASIITFTSTDVPSWIKERRPTGTVGLTFRTGIGAT